MQAKDCYERLQLSCQLEKLVTMQKKLCSYIANAHPISTDGRTALSKHTEIMDIEDIVQFGLLHRYLHSYRLVHVLLAVSQLLHCC